MRLLLGIITTVALGIPGPGTAHAQANMPPAPPHAVALPDPPPLALTPAELRRANAVARHWERQAPRALLVGATGFATQGHRYASGNRVDPGHRYLDVRVVWKAAVFPHSHFAPPLCGIAEKSVFERLLTATTTPRAATTASSCGGSAVRAEPDDVRSAALITFDETTGRRQVTTTYGDVGARPGETLLHGAWPDPDDD